MGERGMLRREGTGSSLPGEQTFYQLISTIYNIVVGRGVLHIAA